MDWRSLLEKYRSQLGWLALAGVALLAVKKDDRWPPSIDTGREANPDDKDNVPVRKTMWNREVNDKNLPESYPASLKIDVAKSKEVPIMIRPSIHFKENWKARNKYVENDWRGLIGRLPSMAYAGMLMTLDPIAAEHQKRVGGTVVEEELTGRVKYTGTRLRKPRMIGGSGRLGMPFHEALILFEVYRFDNDSFEMDLINVLPREARGRFRSQYTEMQSKAWPHNARIDPISADPNEVPRPTYGLWLHEPLTPANANSPESIEWLEGDHSQGGNFSLKQFKKSSKAIGIQPPSSRPPQITVDKGWGTMVQKDRSNSWNELCRVCPALEQSDQGQKIAAIRRLKKEKEYTKKQVKTLLNDTTLLGWGQKEVQKYVDRNCWI